MQVKDLKLDKRNYNKHNDENKRLIKKSIDECGFGRSVVIDNDGEVICGNGVVSTLDENTNIKVVETDGNELVVIRRKDLKRTDEKRDKLAILDNSTGKLSEWDYDLLKEDFEEDYLQNLGIDYTLEPSIDLFDDLEDGALEKKIRENADIFSCTFNFPKEYEKKFLEKLKVVSKDDISMQILRILEIE